MPVDLFLFVYSVSTSTIITAIGIFLKDRYDAYARSRTVENTCESVKVNRRVDYWEMISFPSTEIIIQTKNIGHLLARVLESDYYGVLLIGAPPGAGKSTYLRLAVMKYRMNNNNHNIYYFDNFNIDLFSEIGIPKVQTLQNIFPIIH